MADRHCVEASAAIASELDKLQAPDGGDIYDDRDYWSGKAHELAREVDRLRVGLCFTPTPALGRILERAVVAYTKMQDTTAVQDEEIRDLITFNSHVQSWLQG